MAATERPTVRLAERPPIGRLREQLRAAETALGLSDPALPLALGIPAIDAVLGGGLSRGTLHEIAAAREADIAAATGFALGLAACGGLSYSHPHDRHATAKPQSRPSLLCPLPTRGEGTTTATPTRGCNRPESEATAVVWIAEDLSLAEHGAPYGPGLDATGLAPERLITVAAARGHDVLWAMEEALRCRAIGLVIGELRAREIDPVVTRRLSLAAAAGNTLGLLLRPTPGEETSAAATRWIIGAAPSLPSSHGVGPPRLATRLMRNRRGHLGTWIVEWNRTEQRYVLASANPQPLALPPLDRSHPAAVA